MHMSHFLVLDEAHATWTPPHVPLQTPEQHSPSLKHAVPSGSHGGGGGGGGGGVESGVVMASVLASAPASTEASVPSPMVRPPHATAHRTKSSRRRRIVSFCH